jgi:hypothetical protein
MTGKSFLSWCTRLHLTTTGLLGLHTEENPGNVSTVNVGFCGHVGGLGLGGLGLGGLSGLGHGGLGLGGLDLCGLDLTVGLDPSPPSVHISLCLLCFLVSFLLHVNQHLLFPTVNCGTGPSDTG